MLIGRDLRASSPSLAAAVALAASDEGLHAIDCGALPTPALALYAAKLGAPAVMVTGSHIPDDRNGLKFYKAGAEIDKADEAAILAALPPFRTGPFVPRANAAGSDDGVATADYRCRYLAAFAPDALAGLRIGVFQQSTVVRDLLPAILQGLGATVTAFGRSNAFVPVDTEAHRPEDVATIRAAAEGGDYDAIVSADGDADRPLVADGAGRIVRGDILGLLVANAIGIGRLAVPVTASSAIERVGRFAAVSRTKVGSPYVIAAMDALLAQPGRPVAGFEANGGFLLGETIHLAGGRLACLPTRDAILPIVAALAACRTRGLSLAALVASLDAGEAASDRLKDVPPTESGPFLAALADSAWRAAFLAPIGRETSVDLTDGPRIGLADGGTIHFRASGNAPELRAYAEAKDAETAERLVGWGLGAAKAAMAKLVG